MVDSLVLNENIELLGNGVPSTLPETNGAEYRLAPGWDLGAPVSTQDIIAVLGLDGERPKGRRASNRTVTLPIAIIASDRLSLAAARELLLLTVDQEDFSLRWTRDPNDSVNTGLPLLPIIYDCFRATPSIVEYSLPWEKQQYVSQVQVTFPALPYGRSDVPTVSDFQFNIAGANQPPAAITLDDFSGTPGNWLTVPNSNFEGSVGTWTALTNCAIASTTAQFHSGTSSMSLTSTAAGDMSAVSATGKNGLPVKQNSVVSTFAWFRTAVSVRQVGTYIRWYDVNGVFIRQDAPLTNADSAAAWTQSSWVDFFVAPQDGYASLVVLVKATGAGAEVHYVDDAVIALDWHRSAIGPGTFSAHWDPTVWGQAKGYGLQSAYTSKFASQQNLMLGWSELAVQAALTGSYVPITFDPNVQVGDQFQIAYNILDNASSGSIDNYDFEGGQGSWTAAGNSTIAQTALQAHTGTKSLALTSVAAGNMQAAHTVAANWATQMLAVIPGSLVYCSAWFRSAVSARACKAGVEYYNAAGTSLGTFYGTQVNDTTTGWTQSTGLLTAPASAAWCRLSVQVLATGAAAEVHDIDGCTLGTPSGTIFTITNVQAPFFNVSQLQFTPAATPVVVGDAIIQTGPLPNLGGLSVWAGFGSKAFFFHWLRKGGAIRFTFTLYDNLGKTLAFHKIIDIKGTHDENAPKWTKVRIPIPKKNNGVFNYAGIIGYSIKIQNNYSLNDELHFSHVYLDTLQAVPLTQVKMNQPQRGTVYDLTGAVGTARAPVSMIFQQSGTSSQGKVFATAGTYNWTCPVTQVGTASVRCIGAGAGGFSSGAGTGGAGGGGGEQAQETALAVTPGKVYQLTVGKGGGPGGSGGVTTFAGDVTTVTANGAVGSAGGTGSANSNHRNGGAGGTNGGFAAGGGGGGSGGTGAAGNAGANATGNAAGGAGGVAVTNGNGGGNGASISFGQNGGLGGGGGGSNGTGVSRVGSNGGDGLVVITYTVPLTAKTLLVHRPPYDAPRDYQPFVPVGAEDVPNGNTEYTVPAPDTALNARFHGTYLILITNASWNSPGSSRTVTVTINQYEQPQGNVWSQTVTRTFTPSTDIVNGIVRLDFLTIPSKQLAPDNLNAIYTVTVNDTFTQDRFYDVLFLDTKGSTVIINHPNTGYSNFFIDEPTLDQDIGMIMGSVFDRDDAISLLDFATVSGEPMSIDPSGNPLLLCYAIEGVPNVELNYYPRWYLDRIV